MVSLCCSFESSLDHTVTGVSKLDALFNGDIFWPKSDIAHGGSSKTAVWEIKLFICFSFDLMCLSCCFNLSSHHGHLMAFFSKQHNNKHNKKTKILVIFTYQAFFPCHPNCTSTSPVAKDQKSVLCTCRQKGHGESTSRNMDFLFTDV